MPINDSRIREIILEEVQSIEERCLRYRERLEDAINEIIDLGAGTSEQHSTGDKRYMQSCRSLAGDSGYGGWKAPRMASPQASVLNGE